MKFLPLIRFLQAFVTEKLMRNRIERMVGRLKNFRRLLTRFEKTAQNYLSFVMFACSTLWRIDDTLLHFF